MSKRRSDALNLLLNSDPLNRFATQESHARAALAALVLARDYLKASDNKQTLARVRSAISSAKGAVRICGYREQSARRAEQDIDRERVLIVRDA